jgi:hypothetical protein
MSLLYRDILCGKIDIRKPRACSKKHRAMQKADKEKI